jgi:hypothetical protein
MLPDPWLDEETVTVGLRPSTFPDRKQILDLILSAVPSPSTNGIVVIGDRGSGKSHLLLSVKAGLPDSLDVRTFVGKPELQTTVYGALSAAVEPAGEQTALPGLHVLRALTRSLGPAEYLYTPPLARRRSKRHPEPKRPPLVLLVDDIHYVDPASLAVLLQLMPGFGATLVATADSRRPLPPDLYQLWEDGFLEQYFLAPFTFSEAQALCEDVLGGKVQRRASSLLAAMCGFNVGLLCLAIQDARNAHLLVERDGYWTIDVRAHCQWPGVVDHVRADVSHHAAEELKALEVIALAEPLALDVVEHSFGQKAVEHLLASHHIRVLPGRPPLVRTSSWLWGEGIRLSVPHVRSTALRLGVEEPGLTPDSAPAMLRWMTWTLDCGLSLSDELILAAAPAADRPSTAELAIRASVGVKGPGHRDQARMLRARALIAGGKLKEATPELRELVGPGSQPEVQADAARRLMALSLLGAATAMPVRPYGGAEEPEEPSDPAARVMWNVHQAEQLLLSGDAPKALGKSGAAMAAINSDPALEMFRPGVLLRHVVCLRHNLSWSQVDSLLDCPWAYAVPAHLAWCLDVARGYAQLSQGLPRAALRTLEPVVAELHDAGLAPVLRLASALLAYSEAQCGDLEQAMARVEQSQAAHAGLTDEGLLPQLSALFVAAAQDRVSGKPGHLFSVAEVFHDRQSPLMEAEALALMTLNASTSAVDDLVVQRRLGELAASLQGAGAAAMGTFASALLGNDPKSLESAGKSLSGERQFAQAALCYARAASGYEERTRSAASRRASTLMERLHSAFDSDVAPPLGWLPGTAGH